MGHAPFISYHGRLARALLLKTTGQKRADHSTPRNSAGPKGGTRAAPLVGFAVRTTDAPVISSTGRSMPPFMLPADFPLIWRIRTFGRKADLTAPLKHGRDAHATT